MRPMNFRRTFYPVGQGAFYVEEFKLSEDSKFTIVYDCGSTTLGVREFKKRIKGIFPKEYQIDVLFISHFHADHINGINKLRKYCKIKEVVLPLISDETEIIILQALNYLETNDTIYNDLIENPEKFFSESNNGEWRTTITRIAPIDDEEEHGNNVLKSGTEKGIQELYKYNWVFIPYNFKQKDCIKDFQQQLTEKSLSIETIMTIIKTVKDEDYKDTIKKLKEIYEKMSKNNDLNETSMILYSGPRMYDRGICWLEHYNLRNANYLWPNSFISRRLPSGCLYTGDINLNKNDLVENINKSLHKVSQFIGTLQVPHHGSKHNFNESILRIKNLSCVIFSFGTENRYGHPAFLVLESMVRNRVLPYFVTERGYDIVVQEGFFL